MEMQHQIHSTDQLEKQYHFGRWMSTGKLWRDNA